MKKTIDYYFAPQSPWTYLGHARLLAMVQATGSAIRVLPADFGQIFAQSGGLPLPKRAPQRQAYRLLELARFRDALKLPLNAQPQYFPVAADPSARLIIAADLQNGPQASLRLSGAVFAAVWAQERDIANPQTLAELLDECGLAPELLAHSHSAAVQDQYDANTRAAMGAGVFGAPSYCLGGEIFWGQDRLDFLERQLKTL